MAGDGKAGFVGWLAAPDLQVWLIVVTSEPAPKAGLQGP